MITWIIQRILTATLTAFAAFMIVFSLLRFVPGDPIELMLGEQAQPARVDQLREQLGLDLPWSQQLSRNIAGLFVGDLGTSITARRPVTDLLAERVGPTLALSIAAIFIALLLALPLGILAGWYPNSPIDSTSRIIAVAGISLPNFWLGPLLLLLFAVTWNLLPLGGYRSYSSLILPAITLGTALAAMLTRMLRAGLIDTRDALFVRAARSKGATEKRVLFFHALRPGTIPVITVVGLQLGALLSGAVITETIFQWPGIGRLLIESVQARDYPVVQGVVVTLTSTYVIVNTLIDITYGLVDPRIRVQAS